MNAAEWAIQTFKNHFISGLCTTNTNFLLQQLLNHLVQQAEITCNLFHHSHLNPDISAYTISSMFTNMIKMHIPLPPPGHERLFLIHQHLARLGVLGQSRHGTVDQHLITTDTAISTLLKHEPLEFQVPTSFTQQCTAISIHSPSRNTYMKCSRSSSGASLHYQTLQHKGCSLPFTAQSMQWPVQTTHPP